MFSNLAQSCHAVLLRLESQFGIRLSGAIFFFEIGVNFLYTDHQIVQLRQQTRF